MILLLLLFLFLPPIAGLVARVCPDELKDASPYARIVVAASLLIAAALLLYAHVPLWMHISLLAVLLLLLLRLPAQHLFLYSLAPLLFLDRNAPSTLSLAAVGVLILGAFALGILFARPDWRSTLRSTLQAQLPFVILGAALAVVNFLL
jgi:hypothetical protein